MAREVLSNGVINPDKYQADWYADLSNNWNLLNNLIGSAISGSEVDSKIATAIQELMIRTFQIVAELPATGTEGVMYLVLIPNTSKYTAYVWENSAYRELGVIQMTITIDDELSTTSENPAQNKVITNALNNKAPISHTHSASDITSGLATVATSGSYNDLSNTPTIPTVNNATLTIQKNGTNVQTFTANQSANATANITVPTKTSDLTNDSGFITSDNTKIPLAGSNAISGSLIPATDNAYDLGDSTYGFANFYTNKIYLKGNTIFNVADDNYICVGGATAQANGANLVLNGKNRSTSTGEFKLEARNGTNTRQLIGKPNGTLSWNGDIIPSTDGTYNVGSVTNQFNIIYVNAVINHSVSAELSFGNANGGADMVLCPKEYYGGFFRIRTYDGTTRQTLQGFANGTLTWSGSPLSTSSDYRLKGEIESISDDVLNAWENLEPKQYKYKSDLETDKENAQVHYGWIAQDVESIIKGDRKGEVKNGLWLHEEWDEQKEVSHEETYTEDVETKSGKKQTVTKTRKVIDTPYKAKGDSYGLRYTECLVVECAYLRKCIKELRTEIEQLKSSK